MVNSFDHQLQFHNTKRELFVATEYGSNVGSLMGICPNKSNKIIWVEAKWIPVPSETTGLRLESESLSSWREKHPQTAGLETPSQRLWFVSTCGPASGKEHRLHWNGQNGQKWCILENKLCLSIYLSKMKPFPNNKNSSSLKHSRRKAKCDYI